MGSSYAQSVAVQRRIDPSDGFSDYQGGFDVTSSHYWLSLGFTTLWAIVLALIWMAMGISAIILIKCPTKYTSLLFKKFNAVQSPVVEDHSFLERFLTAATIGFTLVASLMVIIWVFISAKSVNIAAGAVWKTVKSVVIDAKDISVPLQNASVALQDFNYSTTVVARLRSASQTLITDSQNVEEAVKNAQTIFAHIIASLEAITIVLVAVAVPLYLFSICFPAVTITVGWIVGLLALTAVGVYFASANGMRDVCTAMEEYIDQPVNTTWDKILPCDELNASRAVLKEGMDGLVEVVAEINAYVRVASLSEPRLLFAPLICRPFVDLVNGTTIPYSSEMNNSSCVSAAVFLEEYEAVLINLQISAINGSQIIVALTSVTELSDVYLKADSLAQCAFIDGLFTLLVTSNCQELTTNISALWILLFLFFVCLSSSLVSMLFCNS